MTEKQPAKPRPVYLVGGKRTPFLKMKMGPNPFSAADLGFYAARDVLMDLPIAASDIDEVITGCVMPNADEANISRLIALRLGCGNTTPAWTVQRNCGSGLQAVDNALQDIRRGRHHLVLAGGTEAMSHAPLLVSEKMVQWLANWMAAKQFSQKLRVLAQFRLSYLTPVSALLKGLTDPMNGLSMGQTAENLAYRFGIDREMMDSYALQSHQRIAKALENDAMHEMMTLYDNQGKIYQHDDGVRLDSSMEKLATLKPFFDKKFGMVTAGNSSQVTDGAAFVLLASEKAVKKYQLPVLAKIVDCEWAGCAPEEMGLGPVHAIAPLMRRHQLAINDIDYWEINEAFAAQVLACVKALNNADYCKQHFGLKTALGKIDRSTLNVDGGAIAVGHPVGASGARILLHLVNVLQRENATRGIAAMCIGGGQGGAMLIERVQGVEHGKS